LYEASVPNPEESDLLVYLHFRLLESRWVVLLLARLRCLRFLAWLLLLKKYHTRDTTTERLRRTEVAGGGIGVSDVLLPR
jgi:hypothetical protein